MSPQQHQRPSSPIRRGDNSVSVGGGGGGGGGGSGGAAEPSSSERCTSLQSEIAELQTHTRTALLHSNREMEGLMRESREKQSRVAELERMVMALRRESGNHGKTGSQGGGGRTARRPSLGAMFGMGSSGRGQSAFDDTGEFDIDDAPPPTTIRRASSRDRLLRRKPRSSSLGHIRRSCNGTDSNCRRPSSSLWQGGRRKSTGANEGGNDAGYEDDKSVHSAFSGFFSAFSNRGGGGGGNEKALIISDCDDTSDDEDDSSDDDTSDNDSALENLRELDVQRKLLERQEPRPPQLQPQPQPLQHDPQLPCTARPSQSDPRPTVREVPPRRRGSRMSERSEGEDSDWDNDAVLLAAAAFGQDVEGSGCARDSTLVGEGSSDDRGGGEQRPLADGQKKHTGEGWQPLWGEEEQLAPASVPPMDEELVELPTGRGIHDGSMLHAQRQISDVPALSMPTALTRPESDGSFLTANSSVVATAMATSQLPPHSAPQPQHLRVACRPDAASLVAAETDNDLSDDEGGPLNAWEMPEYQQRYKEQLPPEPSLRQQRSQSQQDRRDVAVDALGGEMTVRIRRTSIGPMSGFYARDWKPAAAAETQQPPFRPPQDDPHGYEVHQPTHQPWEDVVNEDEEHQPHRPSRVKRRPSLGVMVMGAFQQGRPSSRSSEEEKDGGYDDDERPSPPQDDAYGFEGHQFEGGGPASTFPSAPRSRLKRRASLGTVVMGAFNQQHQQQEEDMGHSDCWEQQQQQTPSRHRMQRRGTIGGTIMGAAAAVKEKVKKGGGRGGEDRGGGRVIRRNRSLGALDRARLARSLELTKRWRGGVSEFCVPSVGHLEGASSLEQDRDDGGVSSGIGGGVVPSADEARGASDEWSMHSQKANGSASMPMTTTLFPGRFDGRAKTKIAHRSASMPSGTLHPFTASVQTDDEAMAGAAERWRQQQQQQQQNAGVVSGGRAVGRMERRASTGDVVEQIHFKPHANLWLSPDKPLPSRGELKDQSKELEVQLVKNKKLRLEELARGSATQLKEIKSLEQKIQVARRAATERRDLRTIDKSKLDMLLARLRQAVNTNEMRLVVLDQKIETTVQNVEGLRARRDAEAEGLTVAEGRSSSASTSLANRTVEMERDVSAAERECIALRVRNRMAFQHTCRVATTVQENMRDCDACSDVSGEIGMEITMQCRRMEKMVWKLGKETRRIEETDRAGDVLMGAVDEARIRKVKDLIRSAEGILDGWAVFVEQAKELIPGTGDAGDDAKDREVVDEVTTKRATRQKAEAQQLHLELSQKQDELSRIHVYLLQKNVELNSLRLALLKAKEDREIKVASYLALMKTMQGRVDNLIERVREEEKRAVELRWSISVSEMSVSRLRAELTAVKSSMSYITIAQSNRRDNAGQPVGPDEDDTPFGLPVDNSSSTIFL